MFRFLGPLFFDTLVGPVFVKEMLEVSRRKRYYFNRVLYGVALFIAVALVWESSYYLRNYQAYGGQLQAMARVAQEIFIGVCIVQYGAVYILVPLFVAGLVAAEREANSLELLFTTSLRDREIVLGKLASRLAIMGLLVVCGIPIVSLILLFGGVDPRALLRAEMATLLGMCYAGSVTMYFSTISRSPAAALVRSIWWMAVWILGMPMFGGVIVSTFGIRQNDPAAMIMWGQLFLNPGFLFVAAIAPEMHQFLQGYLGQWFFPLAFVPTVLWCGFLLWRSVARLRLPPTLLLRLSNRWHPIAWLLERRRRQLARSDERRRVVAERLPFGRTVRNPLWLRSRWTPIYDRERHIVKVQRAGWIAAGTFLFFIPWTQHNWPPVGAEFIWMLSFAAAVLTGILILSRPAWRPYAVEVILVLTLAASFAPLLYLRDDVLNEEEVALIFLVPTWIAAFLLTVILSANSLVGDRRRGFLELVLISPLEPREILGGTVLAVAQHLIPIYTLALTLTGCFFLTDAIDLWPAISSALVCLMFGAVLLSLGIICSLSAEFAPAAVLPTFVFGAMLCFGVYIVCSLLQGLSVPFLMCVCLVGPVASWLWTRRSTNPAATACLFASLHLMLVLGAAAFNYSDRAFARPDIEDVIFVGSSPIALLIHQVDGSAFRDDFSFLLVPCYCLALGLNLVLAWTWTIKNFDRLAGRSCLLPFARVRLPVVPIATVNAIPLTPAENLIQAELVVDSNTSEPA